MGTAQRYALVLTGRGVARRVLIFRRHAVWLVRWSTAVHLDWVDLATVHVIQFRVRQNGGSVSFPICVFFSVLRNSLL
jgi:hypothetical protein